MRRVEIVLIAFLLLFMGGMDLSAQTTVSPTSFSVTLDAGTMITKTLTVKNTGAAVSYTTGTAVGSGGSWLLRSPKYGTLAANADTVVTITIDATSTPPGTHTGSLTVSATGRPTITVPITLVVKGLSFAVMPASANFKLTTAEVATQSITVSSADSFTAGATASVPWVTLDKATAPVTPLAPASFLATIRPQGVSPGIYSVNVTVNAVGSSAAPTQSAVLTVSVFSTQSFEVSPSPAQFTAALKSSTASPSSQTIQLRNLGDATTYFLSPGQSWLKLSKTTGSIAANGVDSFSLSVSPATLAAGTHTGSISISAVNRVAVQIPVIVTVGSAENLATTPAALSFNGISGQSAALPASSLVTVTNTGAAATYTATSSAPWLALSKSTGSLAQNGSDAFSVSANPASLGAGTHTAAIQVAAVGKPTRTVDVTFQVAAADDLTVSPGSMAFTGVAGATADAAAKSVAVTNTGAAVAYSVAKSAAWLVLSKTGGSLPQDGSDSFTISANPSTLAAGTHTGTVTVTAPGRPTRTIAVTYTTTVANDLTLSPATMSFAGVAGSATPPASQTVTVTNKGDAVSYSIASSAAWISLGKASGALALNGTDTFSILANPASLAAGTHSGTVTVSAAGRPTRTVAVSFTVSSADDLVLSLSKLAFSGVAGQSFSGPAVSSVKITNKGPAVAYALAASAPWIVVSKSVGNLGANLGDSFTVAANPSTLTAGSYTGSVTASAPGRPTRLLTVTLTVAATEDMKLSISKGNFTGLSGEAISTPASSPVRIYNTGGQVAYTATSSAAWLKPSSAAGTLPQNSSALAYISADATALSAGTHSATIAYRATGRPQRDLIVTLVVTDATGSESMSVTPLSVVSGMALKSASPKVTITVSNTGAQAGYTITKSAAWLVPSKTNGVMPANGSDVFTLSYNLTGIKTGLCVGTLQIQAAGRAPQTVTVELDVSDAATVSRLVAFPPSLEFVSGRIEKQSIQFMTEDGEAIEVRLEEETGSLLTIEGEKTVTTPGSVSVERRDGLSDESGATRLMAIPADPAVEALEIPVQVRAPHQGELTIVRVADGGGLDTRIVLHNPGGEPAKARVEFFEALEGGETRPWQLVMDGYEPQNGLSIPAGETVTIGSRGLMPGTSGGWARIRTDQPLEVHAMLRQREGVEEMATALIPANADSQQRVRMALEGAEGSNRSLVVSNLSGTEPSELTVVLRNAEGEIVGRPLFIPLPPMGHLMLDPGQIFPGERPDQASIEVSARGGRLSSLGMRSWTRGVSFTPLHANPAKGGERGDR